MMLLNSLVQELENDFTLEYISNGKTGDIVDIELIDGCNQSYKDNTLYFSHSAPLECEDKLPPNFVLDKQPEGIPV